MFITEIAVAGYQSHYRTGLKLAPFTVVFGESDVGKSALYRAIRALIIAEQGDSFISIGAKKAGVALRLSSGEVISWSKRKGVSAEYKMGEERWSRSKTPPEKIVRKLKITPLVVDGVKIYPNFQGQFDLPFLLFESPPKRSRMLGALISNLLLLGIRQANMERNRNEADIRVFNDLVSGIEKEADFDWVGLLSKLKGTQSVLKESYKLVDLIEKINLLVEEREELIRLKKFKVDILPQKFFSDIESLLTQYEKISDLAGERADCIRRAQNLLVSMSSCKKELVSLDKELKELREQVKITCPHCGKDFSYMELDE